MTNVALPLGQIFLVEVARWADQVMGSKQVHVETRHILAKVEMGRIGLDQSTSNFFTIFVR